MYLFRGCNYTVLGKQMEVACGGNRPDIRGLVGVLGSDGYVFRLKIWLFWAFKRQLTRSARNRLAKEWGIHPSDIRGVSVFTEKTTNHLYHLASKYRAFTPSEFDGVLARVSADTRTWLRKFTYKKLRFIVESQGMDFHDLEAELLYQGIKGVYMMYPVMDSYLHAVNIAKRVMHNQGMNLIKHYTTPKKTRYIVGSDGLHQARVVSMETKDAIDALETYELQELSEAQTLHFDVHLVIRSPSTKMGSLLTLLTGAYDAEFTDWLNHCGYKLDTNEELYSMGAAPMKRYIELVFAYLSIPKDLGLSYLDAIRRRMHAYKH